MYVEGIRAEKPVLYSEEILHVRDKLYPHPIIIAHPY